MRVPLLCLVLACGLRWPAYAGEPARGLQVAVLLPSFPLTAERKFELATELAAQLAALLGEPASGQAFQSPADFGRRAARGELEVALVDPLLVDPDAMMVVGTAAIGARAAARYQLVTRGGEYLFALQGRRLALAQAEALAAPLSQRVLEGEVALDRYFGDRRSVPDAHDALEAVRLQVADVTLAPAGLPLAPLRAVPVGPEIPYPALVVLRTPRARELATRLRAALERLRLRAPFDRIVPAGPDAYRASRGPRRPGLLPPRPLGLPPIVLLPPAPPPIPRELLWIRVEPALTTPGLGELARGPRRE